MIAKGSSGVKAYVGSTEVSKMYKGDVLVYSSTPIPLPYDAEIEYLETDGTAYIDTGISPASITPTMEARIYRTKVRSATYVCGADGSGNGRFSFAHSSAQRIELRLGNYNQYSGYGDTGWNVLKIDWPNRTKYIDGVLKGTSTAAQMDGERSEQSILIFCMNSASGTLSAIKSGNRFSYFKLWDNNTTLLRDLIPVRVGTVGYMYDKVSKQLFGNAAESGAFVLGADVSS